VLALLLIVMSGSRGALLSYCVGCIVLLLLANLPVWQKVAAVSVAATLTVWALTSTVIGEQASETFQRRVVQTTFENRHVSGRDDLWLTAHEMAMEKPVFGWGLNGFAANSWHYPHNIVLEVLVEVGLIGLSLLVLATMSWMCRYWRYRRVMSAAAAAAVMLALTSAQTSGDLYDSRCYFLLLVLATP
jgi:O-antigen ligase